MKKMQLPKTQTPSWLIIALVVILTTAALLFMWSRRDVQAAECGYDGPVIMALGGNGYGGSSTGGLSLGGNGCGIEIARGKLGNPFLTEEDESGGFKMEVRLKFHLEEGLVDLIRHGDVNVGVEIQFLFPLLD